MQEDKKEQPNATEKQKNKKNAIIFISILSALLILLLLINQLSQTDFFLNNFFNKNKDNDSDKNTIIFDYPDWNTDIFTLPEYLSLNRDIKYSPDGGSVTYTLTSADYGNRVLAYLRDYFDSVIRGEHEKLNSLFTDSFWKNSDYTEYTAFPMQKIHNIKVVKRVNPDASYTDTASYDVHFFTITYQIYKNDGLFRNDIDSDGQITQAFWILAYDNGEIKIDKIIALPGYPN